MEVDLGPGAQQFSTQPQKEQDREAEADIWSQESHDVCCVNRTESEKRNK